MEILLLILSMLVAIAAVGGLVWALLSLRQLRLRFKPILDLEAEQRRIKGELQTLTKTMRKRRADWQSEFEATSSELRELSRHLDHVRDRANLESYGLYTPRYDFATSEDYKGRLDSIRQLQKKMIRDKNAAICTTEWTVEGSKVKGRQMTQRQLKLQLRAFNGECDAAISKVKYNNVVAIDERLNNAHDAINKLGEPNHCSLTSTYLHLKQQELYLVHEYQEKKQEEKEEQRRIREQMREEERARKEIEKARTDAERDERRYQEALEKAQADLQSASEAKQAKLQHKIAALEARLDEAHTNKERAISRAQLTKSGHVYVISNIGSFGTDVFKIGMTRRLDPLDRVKELGDASVPFPFDIHAMIYSDNAPEMEGTLHRHFEKHRVNLVNHRKEFFHIAAVELETIVKQQGGSIEFTLVAEAEEYHKTMLMRDQGETKDDNNVVEIEIADMTKRLEDRMKGWQEKPALG